MESKKTERIIEKIAIKKKKSKFVIRKAILSQWEFLAKIISSADPENGYAPNMRMIYFGSFHAKKHRMSKEAREAYEKKRENYYKKRI